MGSIKPSEREVPSRRDEWKKKGQVVAIPHQGLDWSAACGLDVEAGCRPLKSLAPVLAVFGTAKDGSGLAYWFASANSLLGGKRPHDGLLKSPDRVLAAAADKTAEIANG